MDKDTIAKNSIDEQIAKLNDKMEKLQRQKKAIISREKEKERKARTKRLIENGALAEKYLNCEKISPADFELILKKLVEDEHIKALLAISSNINTDE